MSGAADVRARAVTVRQIAKYGAPAVVTFVASDSTETEETCSALRDFDDSKQQGGWGGNDSILDGDEFFFLDAPSLSRRPDKGDRLTVGSTTYAIVRSKVLHPGLLPILYEVQGRT